MSISDDQSLVLVVDDNRQSLKILGNLVKEYGYKVAVAQNGRQALEFVHRQTERMRMAGIDAYWEKNQSFTGGPWGPGNTYEYLFSVYVAQPHLVCAMVQWKLGFKGIKGWQRMSPAQRYPIAVKALVDGMLLHGSEWDHEFITQPGRRNAVGLDDGIKKGAATA